jgi:transcription termination factor Rho
MPMLYKPKRFFGAAVMLKMVVLYYCYCIDRNGSKMDEVIL